MSISLYYFSATGNSLVVAKELVAAIGAAELIPITKAIKDKNQQPFDTVGFVYPVYMFGLPLIVADFLARVQLKPQAYIFGVATYGGLMGRCHTSSKKILKKRGLDLAAGFSVRMPGNYTPLYGAIPSEKQEELLAGEKLRVKEIAQAVSSGARGISEQKPFLMNFLLHSLLYKGGAKQIPLSGKNFWVMDTCTKCGLCSKVCPVENIEIIDGKPHWRTHCQHCMACLQWCPVEAIQHKQSTLHRKRYHHPAVSAHDIIAQRQF
jgi:ferredoxin